MGVGTICKMHGYYSCWGHFLVDLGVFPGGREEIRQFNQQLLKEANVRDTVYTLSGFLKPMSKPEPFITPKPDPRLAKWDPETTLSATISPEEGELIIENAEGVEEVIKQSNNKVICLGNEMIEFKSAEAENGKLHLNGVERGAFKTEAVAHKAGCQVKFMYVSGYHNFYPGTVDMNNEMARYIGQDAQETDAGVVILDGYESCFETGHSEYALNTFAKTIYDMGGQKDRLMCYSLTQGNYNWHMMSYQSWGEYELEKGFRGTCLDYRLMRQMQYQDNLVPNKMGQYYPTDATAEDIEWLMARVCGWDSGVDFNLDIWKIAKNPEYEQICKALQGWEKARMNNLFSEKEKMFLRQTDRLYHLEEQTYGKLTPKFMGFWQDPKVKIMPPSVFSISGELTDSIKPCSAKWAWTHNHAIYTECGLSDDLIHKTQNKTTSWTVTFPGVKDDRYSKEQHILPLIRVPKSSATGVKNIRVKVNGADLILPVELHPGEYLSIPHDNKLGCIYDGRTHDIKREFRVPQLNPYWYLPNYKRGEENTVSATCEPLEEGKNAELILNLRYWKKILPPKK
jgi:hypothetical protein